MKRYCLSVRGGGCVLNCSAFLDIYDNYVLISDRYNNMVSTVALLQLRRVEPLSVGSSPQLPAMYC